MLRRVDNIVFQSVTLGVVALPPRSPIHATPVFHAKEHPLFPLDRRAYGHWRPTMIRIGELFLFRWPLIRSIPSVSSRQERRVGLRHFAFNLHRKDLVSSHTGSVMLRRVGIKNLAPRRFTLRKLRVVLTLSSRCALDLHVGALVQGGRT